MSSQFIYGASILDDGVVLSIEDVFTENSITYIARDVSHMRTSDGSSLLQSQSYGFRGNVEATGTFQVAAIYASSDYVAYLERMKQLANMNLKQENVTAPKQGSAGGTPTRGYQ